MSQQLSELCDRYAAAHGARASWIVRAGDGADVLAQTGIVGAHDRIVAFSAGAGRARLAELFRWQHLSFADELTPQAFFAASELVDAEQAERDRLVPSQGSPASYAHPAGISSGRLFWFAPSIDAATLRVADIRALAAAAQRVGAILVIDNTLPRPSAAGRSPRGRSSWSRRSKAWRRVCSPRRSSRYPSPVPRWRMAAVGR